ncbi:MAG: hypothetical protein JJT81_19915 [Rubellimicrobium sp.]|nr:hypothetical protein [Rubellimicrobium sp.]
MGRFIYLVSLAALAISLSGCDETTGAADLPPEGTPYISVSYGSSEWGGGSTRYFATDVAVTTRWEGVGGGERQSVTELAPGTYDRAAAWLAREGPRALARHGAISICPGEAGGIGAVPPVGGFDYIVPDCTRDSEAYENLRQGLMAVLREG